MYIFIQVRPVMGPDLLLLLQQLVLCAVLLLLACPFLFPPLQFLQIVHSCPVSAWRDLRSSTPHIFEDCRNACCSTTRRVRGYLGHLLFALRLCFCRRSSSSLDVQHLLFHTSDCLCLALHNVLVRGFRLSGFGSLCCSGCLRLFKVV